MRELNGAGAQTQFFVYLSRLIGRRVDLAAPHAPGKLVDVIAAERTPPEKRPFPAVTALVVRTRAGIVRVEAAPITPGRLALGKRVDATAASVGPAREMMLLPQEFRVRELLLDKQVVDVKGAKVVRVNDVQLLVDSRGLYVIHVDVGFRGLLRRIGIERAAARTARMFRRSLRDDLISWKHVHPVTCDDGAGACRVRLEVTQQALHELHPGELADILEDLDRDGRLAMVRRLPTDTAAEVLEEVDENVQKAILEDLAPEMAADIVEEMEPSEAVDVLATLGQDRAETIMRLVEEDEAKDLRLLAKYEEGTAGALMTNEFIAVPPDKTVADAQAALRKMADEVEGIYYVYLTDEAGVLRGVVSLRQLVTEPPERVLLDIAEDRLVALRPDTPDREVAQIFEKYGFLQVPVTERAGTSQPGRMLGLVSLKHALDEIRNHFGQEG